MATEPLSARAYRAALHMWGGDPRMREPKPEDFGHLDHAQVTAGELAGPIAHGALTQHADPTSIRAFQAAQRMHADSPTMAQPQLKDFAHLDTTRPGPHAGFAPTGQQASSSPAAHSTAADQPGDAFDARVRAALAALPSLPSFRAETSTSEAASPSGSRPSTKPPFDRSNWM